MELVVMRFVAHTFSKRSNVSEIECFQEYPNVAERRVYSSIPMPSEV